MIIQVKVALNKTVVDSDWHFDNLWGSHFRSQTFHSHFLIPILFVMVYVMNHHCPIMERILTNNLH